ncbi:MAG TPA: hypothetical protein DER56_04210 [Thermosipho africanus]|nr:hypothetical protein [Thermosipho africanus]
MPAANVEILLKQLIENRQNPIKWMEDNLKIQHPAHGIIPFKLYDFQKKVIKLFLQKHFIITLKSRQIGMSTIVQAICLWSALHYSNYNILIISAGQRNASSFLGKIRNMYEYLPNNEWKLKLETDNKQSLTFSNGSKITAIPATRSASLGESINLLVIDEAAFIERVEEVYQAAYPTISRAFKSHAGKPYGIIIISTPNGTSGAGGWYYQMYEGALNKTNKYIPVKIHWSAVPEYDEEWYLDQCSQLNWNYRSIAAELELSFVSSGNTYIPGQILDSIGTVDPIAKDLNDNLWIFEKPIPGEVYVAGVDVAYGDRKDSSTIQILKASTLEQVAEYDCNTIIPDDFADIVIDLTRRYNNCLVNIERNAVGKVLIDKILYKTNGVGINLFRNKKPSELTDDINKDPYRSSIGTNVTGTSRDILLANMYNILIDKYTEAVNNIISEDEDKDNVRAKFEMLMNNKKNNSIVKKYGIIKSERLLHQLLNFTVDEHGKVDGPRTDLIFGWVHALYAYTKSKQILLRNYANIINQTLGVSNDEYKKLETIKFMQEHSNSSLWKNLNPEEIQKLLDEDEDIGKLKINNDDEDKKGKKTESSLNKIYKAFYG